MNVYRYVPNLVPRALLPGFGGRKKRPGVEVGMCRPNG